MLNSSSPSVTSQDVVPHTDDKTHAAIEALDLKPAAKAEIARQMHDPPPSGLHANVNDAIAAGEIRQNVGESESTVQKAVRVALWALVFYPRQYVAYNRFVALKEGNRVAGEDSEAVRQFRKNLTKVRDAVEAFNINSVGLTTQMKTVDVNTVSGFRLTVDADDFLVNRIKKGHRSITQKLKQYETDISDARCDPMDIRNPAEREWHRQQQQTFGELHRTKLLEQFTSREPFLLTDGRKSRAKK